MGTPADGWDEAITADAADAAACRVAVYAQPRASRTHVVGLYDGMVKIALAAPPVDGAANKALIQFLARALGVPRRQVLLASGQTGRRKRVRIDGLNAAAVIQALSARA